MKAKRRVMILALVLVSVAAILGSCQKKTCPAYSKTNNVEIQQNA